MPQFQVHGTWTNKTKLFIVGDVVIIKNECIAQVMWKLGKVVRVDSGSDIIIRVVTLKTGGRAEIKRPAVKFCGWPIEDVNHKSVENK